MSVQTCLRVVAIAFHLGAICANKTHLTPLAIKQLTRIISNTGSTLPERDIEKRLAKELLEVGEIITDFAKEAEKE